MKLNIAADPLEGAVLTFRRSRRNLLALLTKLADSASNKTIRQMKGNLELAVVAERDEDHYVDPTARQDGALD